MDDPTAILRAVNTDGVARAPDREQIRKYAVQWAEEAKRARAAGKDPSQIAREQFEALERFGKTLPGSEHAAFQDMLAEELEAAHRRSGRR